MTECNVCVLLPLNSQNVSYSWWIKKIIREPIENTGISFTNTDIKIQWGTNICLNLLEIMLNQD